MVEILRGAPYHKVLRERLLDPLGLRTTTVLMEEMLAHSCAVGHVILPGQPDPIVPPMVMMSYSHAPAGSMTTSTPGEVLRFVRMHLDGGRARDGSRVLSAASVKSMQQVQAKLPVSVLGQEMGLGWILAEWDGERMIGHGGGTIGQTSFLHALPERGFGVCLLTNSATGFLLWRDLGRYVFDELAGVRIPDIPRPPAEPPAVDLGRYAGTYRRLGVDMQIAPEGDGLAVEVRNTGALAELAPPQKGILRPIDAEVFHFSVGGVEAGLAQFMEFDRSGRPRWLHAGGRVSRRVSAPAAGAKTAQAGPKAGRRQAKSRPRSRRKGRSS
jgi:CubicO group peptidase (beta-lactamase class C family)